MFVMPSLNLSNSIGPGEYPHSGFKEMSRLQAEVSESDESYASGMLRIEVATLSASAWGAMGL